MGSYLERLRFQAIKCFVHNHPLILKHLKPDKGSSASNESFPPIFSLTLGGNIAIVLRNRYYADST